MKKAIFGLILIGFFCASFKCIYKKDERQITKVTEPVYSSKEKLVSQINKIKTFVNSSSKYNTEIGFFIDMEIASGKNRFFIYDLKNNKLLDKGLVGHGSGSETGVPGKLKFSNTDNSLCTSLGKYSVGYSYQGTFGKAYKLYGLDKTNSNAFNRNVVLHKYSKVPFEEQETDICNSYGCPMVNDLFFDRIEKIIDNSKKKIILTIYY
jgi:hypothetical protein